MTSAGHAVTTTTGFDPDTITREVIGLVEREFADHPGDLDTFDWPVTPAEAHDLLQDFINHRLALFGTYQDAMWAGEPFLYPLAALRPA